MSSYLNIYLKPTIKEGENPKEPMYLMCFSRCNEIYSIMIDELNITFIDKRKYIKYNNNILNIYVIKILINLHKFRRR